MTKPDDLVRGGLTIREHFAAMAMQGMLSNPSMFAKKDDDTAFTDYARDSIRHADALIKELNRMGAK